MYPKRHREKGGPSTNQADAMDQEFNLKKIMKEIESFSSSHATWKEKKELENQKVVSLGGKYVKKQRLPLSIARPMMKNQKKREQKLLEETAALGHFGLNLGNGSKRSVEKRKPEKNSVLKSSEGYFRNGVLDVKHLLRPAPPSRDTKSDIPPMFNGGKGKKKGSGKKNRGKKKGSGRERH